MVILLAALALLMLFLLPLLLVRGPRDIASPVHIVSVLHIITIVPYLVLLASNSDVMSPDIRSHPSLTDFEVAVLKYCALASVGFITLMVGLTSRLGQLLGNRAPIVAINYSKKRLMRATIVAALIGLGSWGFLMSRVGGIDYFLANLHRRTELLAGSGYVIGLMGTLQFAVACLVYVNREKHSRWSLLATAVSFVTASAVLSSLGGRKSTLHLLVFALLTWHYGVKRFKDVAWKAVALLLLVVPYFIAVPILRSPGAFTYYVQHPKELWDEVGDNAEIAITQLSYVDQYVFVVNYFDQDKLWLGRSYLDLLTAPIPSTLFADKPPVDDGKYLRTIAAGSEVRPPHPSWDLFPSSWPLETFGASYANFGIVGIIIGMFWLGVVYRAAYWYMIRSQFSLYSILVYGYIMLNFHFSNLRIVQGLTSVTLLTVFFVMFFGRKRGAMVEPAEQL